MINPLNSPTPLKALFAALSRARTGATSGPPIPHYAHRVTAVLAVDLQRDFLADDGRMPIARDQREGVIVASNAVLDAAVKTGTSVVYIGNEFPASDWVLNFFRRSAAVQGSRGAELDPRVHRVSNLYFPKRQRDAFSNPSLDSALRRAEVSHLIVLGVMADACVRGTVLGARNRGYAVTVVSDAVGAGSGASRARALDELRRAGVVVAGSEAVNDALTSSVAGRPPMPVEG
jgi:nicotinamidase-related amidase